MFGSLHHSQSAREPTSNSTHASKSRDSPAHHAPAQNGKRGTDRCCETENLKEMEFLQSRAITSCARSIANKDQAATCETLKNSAKSTTLKWSCCWRYFTIFWQHNADPDAVNLEVKQSLCRRVCRCSF